MARKGRIRGITIEIGGNTVKLQKALSEVNGKIRETSSSLNDVNRLLKLNPGNAELLRQRQTYLNQAIEETRQKLRQEKDAMEALKNAGNTEKNQEQQRALAREIIATETELKKLERQAREAASVLGSQMQAAGQKLKTAGSSITSVGRSLSMYVTAPIAGVGAAAVATTAEFDSSMSKVRAISGATGEDFDKLRSKAREMGATTKFTASESAEALNYMAMAGWKTTEMLDGIEGVMNLAAASGEDLATTSDIVTDALTAFGHTAEDSGRLADIMAAASANANTNVGMMGETFKYAAPVAGALGMSMEDTALATGLMANNGIKASMAGTTLRTGLSNLVKPTKEMAEYMNRYGIEVTNSDGSMKSLREIMILLRDNMGDLSEAEQAAAASAIFGKRAMTGWLAIINSSEDDFNQLANAIDNSNGEAERMATTMQDNLAGQMTILKSQLQEVAISLGDSMVPMMRKGVEWLQAMADKFNGLDEETKENIVKFGLLAAAIGPALTAVGLMTQGVGSLVGVLGKGITKLTGFIGGLGGISTPVGLALGAIAAGIIVVKGGLEEYERQLREANKEVYETIDASEECRKAMEKAGDAMGKSFDTAEDSISRAIATADQATGMIGRLEELYSANQITNEQMIEAQGIVATLNGLYPDLNAQVDEYGRLLNVSTQEIRNHIENARGMAEVEAMQGALKGTMEELTEAYKAKWDATDKIKKIEEELTKAEEELMEAQKKAMEVTEADIGANMEGATVDQLRANIIGDKKKAYNDLVAELEEAKKSEEDLSQKITETTDSYIEHQKEIEGAKEKYNMAEIATDAAAGAVNEFGVSAEEASLALEGLEADLDETETELEEVALTAEEAYAAMYQDAEESVNKQIGLFDTMSTEYEESIDEMIAAQESQVVAMTQYYDNLEKIWQYVVQTGDESAMQYVQSLADMGTQGAGHVAALAKSIDEGTGDIDRALELAGDRAELESQRGADVMAQIKSGTIRTADGIVYAIDQAGNDVTRDMQETGETVEKDWSDSMDGVERTTGETFNTVTSTVGSSLDSTSKAIEQRSGNVESAFSGVLGKVDKRAAESSRTVPQYGTALTEGFGNSINKSIGTVTSAADFIARKAEFSFAGLVTKASRWGSDLCINLSNGITEAASHVTGAASSVESAARNQFTSMSSNAVWWGQELGFNFGNGIYNSASYVAAAASYLASTAAAYLHFSTPDKGALKESDKWGGELAELFAEGMRSGARDVENAANTLANAAALQNPAGLTGAAYGSGGGIRNSSRVINMDMVVNAAPGMDERALANYVIDRINTGIAQEEAVFA